VTDVAERSANASLALEAQLEQRPLAKKQEELEEAEAKLAGSEAKTPEGEDEQSSNPPKVVHKALLKNDDCELDRLRKVRGRFSLMCSIHDVGVYSCWTRCTGDSLKHTSHDYPTLGDRGSANKAPRVNFASRPEPVMISR
jgi:hypothetical protein